MCQSSRRRVVEGPGHRHGTRHCRVGRWGWHATRCRTAAIRGAQNAGGRKGEAASCWAAAERRRQARQVSCAGGGLASWRRRTALWVPAQGEGVCLQGDCAALQADMCLVAAGHSRSRREEQQQEAGAGRRGLVRDGLAAPGWDGWARARQSREGQGDEGAGWQVHAVVMGERCCWPTSSLPHPHLHRKRRQAAATSGWRTSAAPATQQPTSGTLYAAASVAASGIRLRPRSMVSKPSCAAGAGGEVSGHAGRPGCPRNLASSPPWHLPKGTRLFHRRHGAAQLLLQTLRQRRGSQALGQQRPQVQDGGGRHGRACQHQPAGAIGLCHSGGRQQVCKAGGPRGTAGRHLQPLRRGCGCTAVRGGRARRVHRDRHGSAAC